MAVTLWVKNVPAQLVAQLNERAERNGRSLQGELRAILDDIVRQEDAIERLSKAVKRLGRTRRLPYSQAVPN